jgi:hypothetical protein
MSKLKPVLLLGGIFLSFAYSCNNGNRLTNSMSSMQNVSSVAWNEDTTNSVYIFFYNSYEFASTLVTRNATEIKRDKYRGTYLMANDSLFLIYKNGRRPTGVTDYLTMATGGTHWIQYFVDNDKRMFLRIDNLNRR